MNVRDLHKLVIGLEGTSSWNWRVGLSTVDGAADLIHCCPSHFAIERSLYMSVPEEMARRLFDANMELALIRDKTDKLSHQLNEMWHEHIEKLTDCYSEET